MPIAVATLNEIFERILDETLSGAFDDTAKSGFLNDAQRAVFHALVAPNGIFNRDEPEEVWQGSKKNATYLSGCIKGFLGTSTAGVIPYADIQTATGLLPFVVSGLRIDFGDGFKQAKWRTWAEITVQRDMAFMDPTQCEPVYSVLDDGLYFLPDGDYPYSGVAVCYPSDVDVANPTDSVMYDGLAGIIAYKAAMFAGVAIRDDDYVRAIAAQMNEIGI